VNRKDEKKKKEKRRRNVMFPELNNITKTRPFSQYFWPFLRSNSWFVEP